MRKEITWTRLGEDTSRQITDMQLGVVSLKTILEIKNSDEPCKYTVNIIKILHRSRLNFKKKRK